MGWTEEPMRGRNVNEHFERVFHDMEFVSKGFTRRNSEYYRAFKDKEGEVHALVILFSRENNTICWKPETDSVGPLAYNCPMEILNMLSKTDNEYSNEWRRKCREKFLRNKDLIEGVKIKMKRPLSFRVDKDNLVDCDLFEVVRVRNGKIYSKMLKALPKEGESFICRIKNWRDLDFEILD